MRQVDMAIQAINAEELMRRRRVRGLDLNDHIAVIDSLVSEGLVPQALELLEEIIAVVETLEQFDDREPQPYWYERAAGLHRRSGNHEAELDVLGRWLIAWPPARKRADLARDRVRARYRDVVDRYGI